MEGSRSYSPSREFTSGASWGRIPNPTADPRPQPGHAGPALDLLSRCLVGDRGLTSVCGRIDLGRAFACGEPPDLAQPAIVFVGISPTPAIGADEIQWPTQS